jgi:hypothetical protein
VKPSLTALVLSIFAVLLGPISCTCESRETGAAHSTAGLPRATQEEAESSAVARRATQPGLPAPGEIEIVPTGETVTVLANQASLTQLVRGLSRSFGFELELLAFEDRPVEVRAVGATLGDVLAEALEGVPYAVRYGVRDGRSRLAWLAVGEGSTKPIAARLREPGKLEEEEQKLAEREKERNEHRERSRSPTPEEAERTARFLAERTQREAARRAEALEDLRSRDSETREAAAQMLDPGVPADVDRLAALAAYDDDFEVRVAAVEQLELSSSRAAARAVAEALRDPQPEVVVAAVKALRLLGDSSTVPMVQPLLEHENEDVRVQAEALLELLQKAEPAQ